MPSPEIAHVLEAPGQPYNPAKAHEYYLRTRELKGRTAAAKPLPAARSKAVVKTKAVPVKKAAPPKKTVAQTKAQADAAVAALQTRLTALRKALAALVKQAQAKSGVKSATTSPTAKKASRKPETSAQKEKASAAAKAYYEKHKDDTDAEKTKQLNAQIKAVQAKIAEMKKELAAAAAKMQKKPSAPKPAAKK